MTPLATDAAQALALDARALSGLKREAQANPAQALSKAAGQFEAMFLQMVLKQMRETLPRDGPFDSDTMRTYTSMFDQQIAQHLGSRGLGLREAIERQLARVLPADSQSSPAAPSPAPAGPAESARAALRRLGATAPAPLPDHATVHDKPGAAIVRGVEAFVARVRPQAEAAAAASGIPAHLLIAQAGLETGWGRSQPRNPDGSASHNLFGIKAGGRWTGASVAAATTEYVQGAAVRTVERFRSYGSPADAFRDFTRLMSGTRYADARASAQAQDGAAYARNLQRAGYATDPRYADKLIRAIDLVTRHLAVSSARPVSGTSPRAEAGTPPGPQVPLAPADNRYDRSAS